MRQVPSSKLVLAAKVRMLQLSWLWSSLHVTSANGAEIYFRRPVQSWCLLHGSACRIPFGGGGCSGCIEQCMPQARDTPPCLKFLMSDIHAGANWVLADIFTGAL